MEAATQSFIKMAVLIRWQNPLEKICESAWFQINMHATKAATGGVL